MKNVFVAIGGSGAKVAEALVRLLAGGVPTRRDGSTHNSARDRLQNLRVDPARSWGAAVALQQCLKEYVELQKSLGDGTAPPGVAASRWSIELDTRVRYL